MNSPVVVVEVVVVGTADEVFAATEIVLLVFSVLLLDLRGDGVKIASPGLVTVGSTWVAGLKPMPSTPLKKKKTKQNKRKRAKVYF